MPSDPLTVLLGRWQVFLLAAYGVHSLTGAQIEFSVEIMAHLGLTLAVGPAGALAASVGGSVGNGSRFHPGWFRSMYNTADYFLADLAAWSVFHAVLRFGSPWWLQLLAGLAAGGAQFLANHLLAGVIRLATNAASVVRVYGGGGGVIVPEEIALLSERGVRVFSPEDGQRLGLAGMVNTMVAECDVELPAGPAALDTASPKSSTASPSPSATASSPPATSTARFASRLSSTA